MSSFFQGDKPRISAISLWGSWKIGLKVVIFDNFLFWRVVGQLMVAVEGQNPAVFIHHWPHSNTRPATHALKCPNDKAQFVIGLIHFKEVHFCLWQYLAKLPFFLHCWICGHLVESPLCSPLWQYYSTGCRHDQQPTSDCLIFLETLGNPIQKICLSTKQNFTRPNSDSKTWICRKSLVTISSHRFPVGSKAKQTSYMTTQFRCQEEY